MRIAVIIPAYNEESNIESLIKQIKEINNSEYQLFPIIINDCSTDKTKEICLENNYNFLDLPVNLGIGGAVQAGMIYAYIKGFKYAMQMDGDGQHPPQEAIKLLEKIKITKSDIVIGSRFLEKEGFKTNGMRRAGILYLQLIIKLFTGLKITDSTSGFRLYNHQALKAITSHYPDEYPEPEAIVYFNKLGLRIIETPVRMKSRQGGKSSISFINSIYYFWKVSLAIFYSYLKS